MDLQSYLDRFNVRYHVTEHPVAYTAQALAEAEHVSGYQVIKPVLIECDGQMILCAVPACGRVDLEALRDNLDADYVRLASEDALKEVFRGCEVGAEPPIGALFGLPTIADESLLGQRKVTFQAGNHHEAVTMSMDDYRRLAQPGIGRFAIGA
ncbi:MAG TPA: YbaK/EbsC family protein [Tepidisphaeraceae bacterium]|jgi:Ala-tRNA(Pro) deacylase